jgi:DnaJ-class molecular chaperone
MIYCHLCGKNYDTSHVCMGSVSGEMRPYKCPVCNGRGIVSTPPWIASDVQTFTANGTETYPCRACAGTGLVWRREP